MARGRMLNQSVATDKKLNSLSIEAELLYLKTIPHLDRDGLIMGDPMLLWAKVCPRRPELMGKVADLIAEWIAAGLVARYTADDEEIIFFPGFAKNQANMRYEREPASTFPSPPGFRRNAKGLQQCEDLPSNLTPTFAGSLPEVCRSDDGTLPLEEKRREEKKKRNIREEEENNAGGVVVVGGSVLPMVTSGDVHTLWQNNMPGTMTQIIADELNGLIDAYTPPEVDTAIRLAVKANKRSMSYVAGILRKRAAGEDKPPPRSPVVSGNLAINLTSV